MAAPAEIDQVTLRRAQLGERDAWQALVAMYQGRVYGLCRRIIGGGDTMLAQDAAQDTFVTVFSQLPTFSTKGAAKVSTWILTIASHRAIDLVRKRGSETRLLQNAAMREQSAAAARSPQASVEFDLEAALQALTAEHRAVFILCDVYEFSYAEVSAALDLELGTVRSRLARAREAARTALAQLASVDAQRRPA